MCVSKVDNKWKRKKKCLLNLWISAKKIWRWLKGPTHQLKYYLRASFLIRIFCTRTYFLSRDGSGNRNSDFGSSNKRVFGLKYKLNNYFSNWSALAKVLQKIIKFGKEKKLGKNEENHWLICFQSISLDLVVKPDFREPRHITSNN